MSLSLRRCVNPLSAANGCSLRAVAAGEHTHLTVHHSTTKHMNKKAENRSEVLKSDEGHARTHVVYELQI